MTDTFLPNGYEAPKAGGNYLKFNQGDNVFRILDNPILGWLDWTNDNKPVRYQYNQPKPVALNPDKSVKHFWALPVWDYKDKAIKILEITQSGIQNAIMDLFKDEAWGSPLKYDLNIKKSGEKLETEYSVIARPPQPLHPEIIKAYKESWIDLNELFKGGDPFNPSGQKPVDHAAIMTEAMQQEQVKQAPQTEQVEDEEINVEKIPF